MNRSDFIKRLLTFYSNINCKNNFYIADSSSESIHIDAIEQGLQKFRNKIKITYSHYPNTNIEEAKRLILHEHVEEKYAAYCGDDDFLIPKSLEECATFLDENNEYSNCHGKGILFSTKDDPLNGSISSVSNYSLFSNEHDDPCDRLDKYLSKYWPIWTVRRTDEFRSTLASLKNIPVESLREIVMGSIPIINGKTKTLDNLYVARQIHPARFKSPPIIGEFLNKDWQLGYQESVKILAANLTEKSTHDEKYCLQIINDGFEKYYASVIQAKSSRSYSRVKYLKTRKLLRERFTLLYKVYQLYFSPKINLEKLRSSKNKWFSDFNEIDFFLKNYKNNEGVS